MNLAYTHEKALTPFLCKTTRQKHKHKKRQKVPKVLPHVPPRALLNAAGHRRPLLWGRRHIGLQDHGTHQVAGQTDGWAVERLRKHCERGPPRQQLVHLCR